MARKLHPYEERALVKAAPRFEKAFRKKGCRARREQDCLVSPFAPKNLAPTDEMPNWAECSWPDEWGW